MMGTTHFCRKCGMFTEHRSESKSEQIPDGWRGMLWYVCKRCDRGPWYKRLWETIVGAA